MDLEGGKMCKVFIKDPSRKTVQLLCFEADDEQIDWNRILKISKAQPEFNSTIMMASVHLELPLLFVHPFVPNWTGFRPWLLCLGPLLQETIREGSFVLHS